MNAINMAKQYPCDGFTRLTEESDLVPGTVLRMVNFIDNPAVSAPFSDCVITKVEDGIVYLNRPMGWSNGKTHTEEFCAYTTRVVKFWHTVLTASGKPYSMFGV